VTQPLTVMLVAAEASGDDRGAGLAIALKRRLGDGVRFVGVGGERMRAAGVDSPFNIAELSIFGLVEGLMAYPLVRRRVRETAELAAREKPDVAVLIDSWGFTVRVADRLRALTPRPLIVKYVAPQVWASRPGRAKTAARAFDHLLSIHAFDAPWFEREGLSTAFVGNAALNVDFSGADPARLRRQIGAGAGDPILLVLPGSRPSEIDRVLPAFEAAVARLKADRPDLHVVVPAAPTVADRVKSRVAGWPFRAHVLEGEAAKLDAMKAATVGLACSGTVTTELALAGCPMVVGYRVAPFSYFVAKRLIRTKWVTLFNIAARDFIAPELIQDDCTGEKLAAEVALRLDDPALRRTQVARRDCSPETLGRSAGLAPLVDHHVVALR
jgi:lipid-A-disaccharide synthase